MDRRWFLATLAGVVGWQPTGDVDRTLQTAVVSDARPPESTASDDESAGRLGGTRAGLTDRISLTEGVTTLDVTYPADSTITLTLVEVDEITDGRRLVVDRTGREAGTVFVADRGEYRIAVATSSSWDIEWTQPAAASNETSEIDGDEATLPPARASSAGSGYIGPLLLARTTELTVEHAGEGPIAVTAYTARGDRQRLLDARGETDEWMTTELTGAVWFDIAATGEWTLDIS